jgi:hypothetical protein
MMIRSAHESDEFDPKPKIKRLDRWLDQVDAAIIAFGRAVWNAFVEGFAAYGTAEFALPLDPCFDRVDRQGYDAMASTIRRSIEIADNTDVRADFADLYALIEYVEAMGG